jgi:quercetin dioxygenase-like cupin family protein
MAGADQKVIVIFGEAMDYILLNREDLPLDGTSREFEGYKYGDTGITFILVEMKPGRGPKLHQHPYEEVFIVLEGRNRAQGDAPQICQFRHRQLETG